MERIINMMKLEQVYLYGIKTTDLFTEEESKIYGEKLELVNAKKNVKDTEKKIAKCKDKIKNYNNKLLAETTDKKKEKLNEQINNQNKNIEILKSKLEKYKTELDDLLKSYSEDKKYSTIIKELDTKLKELIKSNKNVRVLEEKQLTESKKVAQFESTFTRSLGLKPKKDKKVLTTDFFVVEVYYNELMKQLIEKGFKYSKTLYKYKFSSSGQIRDKKLVFVKDKKYKRIENKLTAGLTEDKIDEFNINKLIAYRALCNTSSKPFNKIKGLGKFDINKVIVVPDFIHIIKDVKVDYINSDYTIKPNHTMDIENKVTDGIGMCLPSVSKKNMQIRASWMKGLVSPFNFLKLAEVNGIENPTVKDVWGKEWDLKKDGIEIILTASQFKMWKLYKNWGEYKENFEKYKCEFAVCKIEEDEFEDKPINYQFLQSLYKISDEDLESIASHTKEIIEEATSDTESLIKFVGAEKGKKKLKPYQEALLLHNDLINDPFIKGKVKDKKANMINDARAGKLLIENTKHTFIIPDLYAFAQHLFELPVTGLLSDKEISCKLYEPNRELTVERSPHLYIEHVPRVNKVDENISDWFTTNGCYIGINDVMPFIIMADFDGDEIYIVDNATWYKNVKEHTKDLNPLQYELGVAKADKITPENVYNALISAYKKNIGDISNNISKLYNRDEFTKKELDLIKQITWQNNLCIDYAKTLFWVEPKGKVKDEIKKLLAEKLPAFFTQAKDKKAKQVNKRNNSTVNRLYDIFADIKPLHFEKAEFDYSVLLKNKDVEINNNIIDTYKKITEHAGLEIKKQLKNSGQKYTQVHVVTAIKDKLLELGDKDYVVDVITKYLYESKTENKHLLWDMFGEELLLNLYRFHNKTKECKECHLEYVPKSNNQKYCEPCQKIIDKNRK